MYDDFHGISHETIDAAVERLEIVIEKNARWLAGATHGAEPVKKHVCIHIEVDIEEDGSCRGTTIAADHISTLAKWEFTSSATIHDELVKDVQEETRLALTVSLAAQLAKQIETKENEAKENAASSKNEG